MCIVFNGDEEWVLSVIHVVNSERPILLIFLVFDGVLSVDIEAMIVARSGIVSVPVNKNFCIGIFGGWCWIDSDGQGVSESRVEGPTATEGKFG